jgi:ABC-2 type transport system ATP-binding protein
MLRIEGLVKSFGPFTAVRGLSFQVAGGEIVGLLGPNGAGKTTTLRCVASILQPTAGRITLGGYDVVTQTAAAKRTLAYVSEVPNPYEMLTVMEHLRFVAAAYGTEDELSNAETILKRLDLWEKRQELAATLSKGMRQKLACACAFIHRPRIYCFDEPLIGIDPRGVRELKNMLLERREAGDAVLVSTHVLDTAERLCDRAIIMSQGEVIAEGTVAELHDQASMAADATLEDVFLSLTKVPANEVPA